MSLRQVWKYPVEPGQFEYAIPFDAEFLHVSNQDGQPAMWFLVTLLHQASERKFLCVGTGRDIRKNSLEYLGTFQIPEGVFHLFEVK